VIDNPENFLSQLEKKAKHEWYWCRHNLLYYTENYCYTVDEHERQNPIRPLLHGDRAADRTNDDPAATLRELDGREDDYLRYATLCWQQERLLAVPKSRQMRLTHVCVAWHGWLAQFYPGQRIAIQSKNFEDADALLERLHQSWIAQRSVDRHHGEPVARYLLRRAIPWPSYKRNVGRIILPHGSIIMAIAQGADKLRSYTFSAIMSDEMAFQDEAEAAYTAALPTIEGGNTKYTAISSANPSFFQDLCFDKVSLD
jgi:hypothetical protein